MKKNLFVLVTLFFGTIAFSQTSPVVIEAESYTKETGGELKKAEGRPETSNNICITTWNNKGHLLEWEFNIPSDGKYKIAFRYANGRAWNVFRDMKIDGKYPNEAFKKIIMPSTGGYSKDKNNWKNIFVSDKKNAPSIVSLTKGKHVISMNNLGGDDDQDGACNFDAIGFFEPSADISVLGK